MIFLRLSVRPAFLIAFATAGAVVSALVLVGGENLQASVTSPVQAGASRQAATVDPQERLDRLLARLERRKNAQDTGQIADWSPPIPAAAVLKPEPAPPPPPPPQRVERKPEAPPLPFVYIGHMEVQGRFEVFLGRGADGVTARTGDTIGDNYRVDQISAQAITFTHLPTGGQQVLAIPAQ